MRRGAGWKNYRDDYQNPDVKRQNTHPLNNQNPPRTSQKTRCLGSGTREFFFSHIFLRQPAFRATRLGTTLSQSTAN